MGQHSPYRNSSSQAPGRDVRKTRRASERPLTRQVVALTAQRGLRRQDERFSLGDHDGVFDVGGDASVGGGERPAVTAGADAGASAGADHGFHGDHEALVQGLPSPTAHREAETAKAHRG